VAGVSGRPLPIPIVALDVPNSTSALEIVDELGDLCRYYKIGSELFTGDGPEVVAAVKAAGASVFLDLKFMDIPNTVRGSVRSAANLGVSLLTVHASGGRAMMEAAVAAVTDVGATCEVVAVTVLTSMDANGLSSVWGRPLQDVEGEVLRLARLARDAGVPGVVCSGREAAVVRDRIGTSLFTLVPGVRLAGSEANDQSRVVTPGEAAAAGARYIVVGRTVTGAAEPRDAMKAVLADLS
jgi:orotidine-5'-phosphate decarboxylase